MLLKGAVVLVLLRQSVSAYMTGTVAYVVEHLLFWYLNSMLAILGQGSHLMGSRAREGSSSTASRRRTWESCSVWRTQLDGELELGA